MEKVWPPYSSPRRTPVPWQNRSDPPELISSTSPCASHSYETSRIKQEAWIRVLVYSTLRKYYLGDPGFKDHLASDPGMLNPKSYIWSHDEFLRITHKFTENFMQREEYVPVKLVLNSEGDTVPAPEVVMSIKGRVDRNMARGKKGNFPN